MNTTEPVDASASHAWVGGDVCTDPPASLTLAPIPTEGLGRDLGVELQPVELADRALFDAAFARAGEPVSDMTFVSSFGWAEALTLRFAIIEEHVCLFSAADGDLCMMLPPMPLTRAADARLDACLDLCFEVMDRGNAGVAGGGAHSRIEYVSDAMLDRIRRCSSMTLSASPMWGDYVYPRRAMVDLTGGPLKAKRKLRSRFLRENPAVEVGPIRPMDVPACVELLGTWRRFGDERHEGEANANQIGTDVLRARDEEFTVRLLERSAELGLETMLVRSRGRLVGFTIGERVTPTMGVVYVEKTDPDFVGAPQFIYSTFCERSFKGAAEINAGDDWGIASLRFTKESYRPSRLLNKSVLTRSPVMVNGAAESLTVARLESGPRAHRGSSALPAKVLLRKAGADDAARLAELDAASFPTDDRFTVRQIRRLIANPRARVRVAVMENKTVGWSVTLERSHRRWRSGRLYSVAVDPAFAGRGIGRSLVGDAVGALESAGVTRVYLEVRCDNAPAIALYRSFGFEVIARLRGYYGYDEGRGGDGLRMRRIADDA